MILSALLLLASACAGGKVEVHGVAVHSGELLVYPSQDSDPIKTQLTAGKKWSVCVDPTQHEIKPDGPYVPWFNEVHYSYTDGSSMHQRWAIPVNAKSLPVDKVVTDGVLR